MVVMTTGEHSDASDEPGDRGVARPHAAPGSPGTPGGSDAVRQLHPTRSPGRGGGAPGSPGRPSRDRRAWLFIAFAVFSVAWGGNEFTPLLVFYRGEDVFSPLFVDSLMAAYACGIGAGLMLAGPLSDRYGRRVVMLPAPVVAVLGSSLIAAGETSEIPMFLGRVCAGLAVGAAMSAGGSWIKELSTPAFDPSAGPGAGAKRATMSLTAGFGLGAGVAGVLAQWGPIPGQLPYFLHIAVSVVALLGLLTVPETRQSAHLRVAGSFWTDLRVPSARHPRFLTVVLPVAPWVFGAAGVSYAIMPTLASGVVGAPVAFSALLAVAALASGYSIQQVGPQLNSETSARGPLLGLGLVIVGMVVASLSARHITVWNTVVVAVILGAAYGLCLISGLTEVQRIAGPDDLGGLTAVYYVVTYIGFFFPMILTKLGDWFTYPVMLGFGVVMAVLAFIVVAVNSRRHLPAAD